MPQNRGHRILLSFLLAFGAFMIASTVSAALFPSDPPPEEVTYSAFLAAVNENDPSEAQLFPEQARVVAEFSEDNRIETTYPPEAENTLVNRLSRTGADVKVDVGSESRVFDLFLAFAPLLFIMGILFYFVKKTSGANMVSNANTDEKTKHITDVRFSDIVGADSAVEELQEAVSLLKHPDRYQRLGARSPKGFLLVGPPGTGKTLLAKAVAGEAGVPFFAVSGSDFMEMYVGVGAGRARKLFAKARKEGTAIIFIDELDAIGKKRSGNADASSDEADRTLNALLVEMDGYQDAPGVIIIAATNRPDILDSALLRPGRFDRTIQVGTPDRPARAKIMELHAKGKPLDADVNFDSFARRTPGMSGADLANLVNQAALQAGRENSDAITNKHFSEALATIVVGRASGLLMSEQDQLLTAWHETGHAVCAMALDNVLDPEQVTIVPRGSAGGVTWMPSEDTPMLKRSVAKSHLVFMLGGRAAEEVFLNGDYTQGASSDLQKATSLARQMVFHYGMGNSLVWQGDSYHRDDDAEIEVRALLTEAKEHASRILQENAELVSAMVAELLEHETLEREDVAALAQKYLHEVDLGGLND